MKLKYTRAMITAALDGKLDPVSFTPDPVFGVSIPAECPGVPAEVLNPVNTWEDKNAFKEKASYLAGLFRKNFEKYADGVTREVLDAAPVV
jgi:phosphoenolpyruvate carboxykinase (ATP)